MITPETKPILVFLIALFSALFTLPKLVHIAKRINLLDQPNQRKMHVVPKPLVGGFGFVLSACFAAALLLPPTGLRGFFAGLALMLFIGFLDDLKELDHKQKFIGQIVAVALLIYFSNIRLVSFGDLFGLGEINIPGYWLSVLVTVFCMLGVINSINLIDGLDGLAGGVSFVAFLIFATHASLAQNQCYLLLNLAFAGAVLGFLYFNWHPASLFMGDAGSLCLGFTLGFMALAMTQGNNPCMSPITALLILAVPISDTLTVMTKRIMHGKSPFHPDKYHLHHIFMRYGFGRLSTVKIIIGISAILGGISLLGPFYGVQDNALFLLFIFYFVFIFISSLFIIDLLRYSYRMRRKRSSSGFPSKLLKYVFHVIDTLQIIRKNTRYDVDIPAKCHTIHTKNPLPGTICNISTGGFMATIPQLTSMRSGVLVDISFNSQSVQFTVEHLWISTLNGEHIHGFRFLNMTDQQHDILHSFIDTLE